MVNPDGRQYVENTRNYCWRGTSTGVDLNRNFDWHFGDKGSSGDRTDEEYRGTHAFSGSNENTANAYDIEGQLRLITSFGQWEHRAGSLVLFRDIF